MLQRLVLFLFILPGFIISGCAEKTRRPPLAAEITQNVTNRARLSCDDIEAHYRVAQGVRTGLEISKYRHHILQELAGWSASAMSLVDARLFSVQSAKLLREELTRRCPKHRITGNEDIVYIPS